MSGISRCAASAVIALAASWSLAAGPAAAQAAPKWVVDPAKSDLAFESSAEGAAFEGHFRTWDADIRFDPKQLAQSKVTVTVDTGSTVTGDTSLDQTAHSPDWFSSVVFPKATFVTRGFKDLGGGHYEAEGDLTVRGVSQPLTLPFTLAITGDQAVMTGEVDVDRTLFGVGQGEYGSPDIVPVNVTVKVSLTAKLAR